MFFTKQVVK